MSASSKVMNSIREAAKNQKLLQITYVDTKNNPSIRTIEPYEIKNNGLYGYCTVRGEIRFFKLDRIQSAEVHISEFSPRFPILI